MYQRRCVYQHADDAGVIGVELSKDLVSVASRAMTHNMTKLGGQGRGGRRGGGGVELSKDLVSVTSCAMMHSMTKLDGQGRDGRRGGTWGALVPAACPTGGS
jgi:hypothetical protein